MNPSDIRTRTRIANIIRALRVGDLDQWQLADRVAMVRSTGIREYVAYIIGNNLAHVVGWRRHTEHDGPYIPVLRAGPGENVPKPTPRTSLERKAERYARLKADSEKYEAHLRRQRALRRKPPKPDALSAWVFK